MPSYGIHNYANREIGLTSPQVQMATFTPLEFKPQFIDPEHFKSVIDKMDAADAEARKEKTAIDAAYSEQRKQVHNDPKSLQIFDDIVNKYNEDIKNAVNNAGGSYHRLGTFMTKVKADALNDKVIPALTDSNTRYQKWVDSDINARQDIDDLSKEYYREKAEKNFSNDFVKDGAGNIIGSDWKPNVQVYADLHAEDLAKIAISFTAYQEKAGGDTGTHLYTLNESGVPKEVTLKNSNDLFSSENPRLLSNKKTTSWDWTKLTPAQLHRTFKTYLDASPQIREMIREDYAKQEYKRNKALERLQNRESLSEYDIARYEDIVKDFDSSYGYGAGGGGTDFVAHYIKKIEPFLDNASYNRSRTVSGDNLSYTGGRSFTKDNSNITTNLGSTSVFGKASVNPVNNPQAVNEKKTIIENAAKGINDIYNSSGNNSNTNSSKGFNNLILR